MTSRALATLGGVALVVAAAYLIGHVLAAAYGLPPGIVFRTLFESLGFLAGLVVLLVLVFQLIRR